jgi:hypothetical protein
VVGSFVMFMNKERRGKELIQVPKLSNPTIAKLIEKTK